MRIGSETWQKVLRFYFFTAPSFFVWIALGTLAFTVYDDFSNEGKFTQLLTIYLTTVALLLAFSSVSFAFAQSRKSQEKETIIHIGELFLYSAVSSVIALLITMISFKARNELNSSYLLPLYIFLTIGQSYLFMAANSAHKAIIKLEKELWFNVKGDII